MDRVVRIRSERRGISLVEDEAIGWLFGWGCVGLLWVDIFI